MIFLGNAEIAELLDMSLTLEALRAAYRDLEQGDAAYIPRIDVYAPAGGPDEYYRWGSMTGVSRTYGVLAARIKSDVLTWPDRKTQEKYCIEPGTYSGIILLYSTANGEPLALMSDGFLQHQRVGGTAGLGTEYLARQDASRLGVLGSGGMARTYLESISQVRNLSDVYVYSPSRDHREEYAKEMSERLGLKVQVVDSAEEAVRDRDIVATCTDSIVPTFKAEWLSPGTHIVTLSSKEIGDDVLERADVVMQSGFDTLVGESEPGMTHDVTGGIASYVTGQPDERKRIPQSSKVQRADFPVLFPYGARTTDFGRKRPDEITLYFNGGTQGLQFAGVAGAVFRRAVEQKVGQPMPLEWFTQDIRD